MGALSVTRLPVARLCCSGSFADEGHDFSSRSGVSSAGRSRNFSIIGSGATAADLIASMPDPSFVID
jgi:hypothetical protein